MSDSLENIGSKLNKGAVLFPVLRYAIGTVFLIAVTSLWNYELSYLAAVFGLMFIAPGMRPMPFKEFLVFFFLYILVNFFMIFFSQIFIPYPIIFIPLLLLMIFWIHYSDLIPLAMKVFFLMSIVIIPLTSIDYSLLGQFVAVNLLFNFGIAVLMAYFIFVFFPWSETDEVFVIEFPPPKKKTDRERFLYAMKIVLILTPVILLFYYKSMVSAALVLTYVILLTSTPIMANIKVGMAMIIANIIGGFSAIAAYYLLMISPDFIFMLMLILSFGLIYGNKVFAFNKMALIYKTAFSTFVLITGTFLTSKAEAADKVWSRVFLISTAVIYVVVAFRILDHLGFNSKKQNTLP